MSKKPQLTDEEIKQFLECKRKAEKAIRMYPDLMTFVEEKNRSNLRLLLEILGYEVFSTLCLFFMDEDKDFRRVLFPTRTQIEAARKREICYDLGCLKEQHEYDITWDEIGEQADVGSGGEAKKHYRDFCDMAEAEAKKSQKERDAEEFQHNKRLFNWIMWKRWFDNINTTK